MEIFCVEICVNQVPAFASASYLTPKAAIAETRYKIEEIRNDVERRLYGNTITKENKRRLAEWFDGWLSECESNHYAPDVWEPEDDTVDIHFALYRREVLPECDPSVPSSNH